MSSNTYIDLSPLQSIDSLPIRSTALDLIDLDKVAAHIADATKRGRYRGPSEPHEYLLYKKCLVQIDSVVTPTLAGILCFGRHPQDVLPRAVVDLGHYRGVDSISYEVVHLEKDIGGTHLTDKVARQHAHDLVRIAIHAKRLAEHARIAAELALPGRVARVMASLAW